MDRLEEPHIQELVQLFQEDNTVDFNHSTVTWTLENVIKPNEIDPVFFSGIPLEKCFGFWTLTMKPQFKEDSILVQINGKDAPFNAFISCRFGYKSANETIWNGEMFHKVRKDFAVSSTYPTISNYFNATTKTLVLLCEFIIAIRISKTDDSIVPILDRTEYAICVDFYHLYKSGYLSDLTLRIGEIELDAHRAILSAKSEVFRKMIAEMPEFEDTIDLPEIDPHTMQSMLHYIYIGNAEVWAKFYCPTITLYECAKKFEIVNLITYLEACEVDIYERFETYPFEFEWTIENFGDLREANFFNRSPLFHTKLGSFYLNLSRSSSENNLFVINLHPFEISHTCDMHATITILNPFSEKSESFEQKTLLTYGSTSVLELMSLNEDLLLSSTSIPLNVLTISFKGFVLNYTRSDFLCYRTLDEPVVEEFATFKELLENSLYSDLTFIAEGREFSAHKLILGTRLLSFNNLFKIDKRIKEISMDEISVSAMESFLLYLYTGKIRNEIENLLNLLPIWHKYGNNALGAMLFNLLTQNINVENVCNILSKLYSLENSEFFDGLKNAALLFSCRNFFEVECSETWDNFKVKDEKIAKIILAFITSAYRHQCSDSVTTRL